MTWLGIPKNRQPSRGRSLSALACLAALLGACNGNQSVDVLARGAYLVKLGDCTGCHTPWIRNNGENVPDETRLLSGHPSSVDVGTSRPAISVPSPWQCILRSNTRTARGGPWGIAFAANLTAHDSGLATWTEERFIAMMRTGRKLGEPNGRLLNVMPTRRYEHLTDSDLKAIFAYLRSITVMDNAVPDLIPPDAGP